MYTGCTVHTAIGGFTNLKTAALRARKTIELVESEPSSICVDAEKLARYVRVHPVLLNPIQHRTRSNSWICP
jgi:hypothetical protein